MAESRSGRIRELDGWRGISVLLVILHHCLTFQFPGILLRYPVLQKPIWYAGPLGVRTFFVISGFVITKLLIEEERQRGSISIKGFYIRRVFRIIPAFYVVLLATALLRISNVLPGNLRDVAGTGLFLRDTRLMPPDWFTGHAWSLAVEEQFYLVFPLFWILCKRSWRRNVLTVTLMAFLVWSCLADQRIFLRVFPANAVAGFYCVNIGVMLAMGESQARKIGASLPPVLALLVAIFAFLRPVPDNAWGNVVYVVVTPLCIAVLLIYTVSHQGKWASSILVNPIILWIGMVSYSAYLWQELFTGSPQVLGSSWIARVLHSPLSLVVALAVITVSYYCVERPFTRMGRRISQRVTAGAAQKPVEALPGASEVMP